MDVFCILHRNFLNWWPITSYFKYAICCFCLFIVKPNISYTSRFWRNETNLYFVHNSSTLGRSGWSIVTRILLMNHKYRAKIFVPCYWIMGWTIRRIVMIQQHNVRIPGHVPEHPLRRTWVPQPPPEAAEAIRRSKWIVQTKTLANNQLVTPPDMASELQRTTKNGSAGEVGLLGEVLGPIWHSTEIQEE